MNPSIPDLEMPNVHVPPPYSSNFGKSKPQYDANRNEPPIMGGAGQFKFDSDRYKNHYDHGYGRRQGGSGYRQHNQRPYYYSGYEVDKPDPGRISRGNWRYDRDQSRSGYGKYGYGREGGYSYNERHQQQSRYGYSRSKSYNYASNHGRGQMHRPTSRQAFPTKSSDSYKGTPRRVPGSYNDKLTSPTIHNDGGNGNPRQRRSPEARRFNSNNYRGGRQNSGKNWKNGTLYLLKGNFKGTSFRELKDAIMEKCTDCWIVAQKHTSTLVRSSLPMDELLKNFEDFVFNGNKIELTEASNRERGNKVKGERKRPQGPRVNKTNFEIRMVDFKIENIPSQDAVRNALQFAGVEVEITSTLNSGKILKGSYTSPMSKIDFKIFNGLKIGVGIVDKVGYKKKSRVLTFKVVPDYGLLYLSNLPHDYSTASLKKELKKCINYELSIKSLKDGNAEVIFRPKVFEIEELLANLTIDEKLVDVKKAQTPKKSDQAKVVKLPEKINPTKLNELLMQLSPIEASFGGKEFTLKFNVVDHLEKSIEDRVADLLPKPETTRKESWAEEKEKDDEEKLEVPIVFGSTDIREKQKGVKRKQPSETGNESVWVRPTGESY